MIESVYAVITLDYLFRCSISPDLLNYVMDDILSSTMNGSADLGVKLLPDDRFTDLENDNDNAIPGDSVQAVQHILFHLEAGTSAYSRQFASNK